MSNANFFKAIGNTKRLEEAKVYAQENNCPIIHAYKELFVLKGQYCKLDSVEDKQFRGDYALSRLYQLNNGEWERCPKVKKEGLSTQLEWGNIRKVSSPFVYIY